MNGIERKDGQDWFYSDEVKDHFFNPRNFLHDESEYRDAAAGLVGSPACGDVMKVWIKADPQTERITDMKWKTFGCASAIASTSMLSVMVTENSGLTLSEARKIRPQDIMERLGGLPARKIHCSVLGDKALRAAINDWYGRARRHDKIEPEEGRVIDKVLKITDRDIEAAVLRGADTLEKVQEITKVGTGDPSCLPEAEELVRFYIEKHSGQNDGGMPETKCPKIAKIVVDRDVCIGAGPCVTVAPKVFQLDEENKAYVVDPKGADDDTILLAAQACPVQAISLYDEKGNQIYPEE